MDNPEIRGAVGRVRERLGDDALFEALEDTARLDDGIVYVPVKLRELVAPRSADASEESRQRLSTAQLPLQEPS